MTDSVRCGPSPAPCHERSASCVPPRPRGAGLEQADSYGDLWAFLFTFVLMAYFVGLLFARAAATPRHDMADRGEAVRKETTLFLVRGPGGAPVLQGSGVDTTVDECQGVLADDVEVLVLSVPLWGFHGANGAADVEHAANCARDTLKPRDAEFKVSLRAVEPPEGAAP